MRNTMRNIAIALACVAMVGCTTNAQRVQQINQYSPVVDIQSDEQQVKFDKDLRACRKLAQGVQEQYNAKADEEKGKIIAGAVFGAVLGGLAGAAIGDSSYYAGQGAATGLVAGTAGAASESDYLGVMQRLGAKGVVDECMVGRGHRVLNTKGYGGGN